MSTARRRKRRRAVEELLSTEKTYVHLLSKLMEHFVQKLRLNTSMLSNEDYKILFPSDIHAILGLNQTFLEDLKKVIEGGKFNNNNTKIGNIIYAFCPHFKMYQNYLNNYSAAAERLAQLRKKSNSSFSIYCDRQREKKYFNNLPLESLIILPIQRMPRYKMLLEEIIKHTQSNHPDLQQLKQALAKISEVNDSINNRMKDFDARIKVQNIENRFTSKIALVTPSRRYIKHGQLCKIGSKDDQDYVVVLFNDCLLVASQSMIGDKLILGNILYFNSKFKIQKTSNRINVHLIENLFEIHSTTESFMLYASTKQEMNDWIQIISDTYSAYVAHRKNLKTAESSHQYAVTLLIPNDFAEKCMVNGCCSRFNFVNRRHHCKYCGYVVCGKCSSNQLRHRPTDVQQASEMVRVCDPCYKTHAGSVTLPTKVRHHSTEKALGLLGYTVNEKQKKTNKFREDELLKLYTKRAKEAGEDTDDEDGIAPLSMNNTPNNKAVEQKKKRNSAVLDFVKLDIEPKLIALETENKKLEDKISSLKHKNDELQLKIISVERTAKDEQYAEKQTVRRLEKQNNELRADNERLRSLVNTLSSTTDESKRAEEIQNTKIKTLESHNNNLQNDLRAKEDEIAQLLQKQSALQQALQQKKRQINELLLGSISAEEVSNDDGDDEEAEEQSAVIKDDDIKEAENMKSEVPQVPSPNTQYNNALQEVMAQKTGNEEQRNVVQDEPKRICCTCNKEIVGRALRTKGGLHHRACHLCSECKASLAGKLYGVLQKDGKKIKLCETCTSKANEKMIEEFTRSTKKRTVRSSSNIFQQMNKYRNSANKVPKLWDKEQSNSPTLKPSLVRSLSNEKSPTSLKKTQSTESMFKGKRANLKKVQKKKNSRASTLMAQRKCNKCKTAVFGKNSISGPNNSVYHPNCFRCNDCSNTLFANKWRNYPVIGQTATTLTLCPDCARKRDEALFSQYRGKLNI